MGESIFFEGGSLSLGLERGLERVIVGSESDKSSLGLLVFSPEVLSLLFLKPPEEGGGGERLLVPELTESDKEGLLELLLNKEEEEEEEEVSRRMLLLGEKMWGWRLTPKMPEEEELGETEEVLLWLEPLLLRFSTSNL